MENQLSLTPQSKNHLISISKWGLFISIVNFVMAALCVLIAVLAGATLSSMMAMTGASVGAGAIMGLYVVVAVVIAIPAFFLFKYSQTVKNALYADDADGLENSLKNLKMYFQINGIILLILVTLYALLIGFFVVVGAAAGLQ
jgi:hypothetical protein